MKAEALCLREGLFFLKDAGFARCGCLFNYDTPVDYSSGK